MSEHNFNIIPIPKNTKIPKIEWKKYQNELYPSELLPEEENSNFAIICGKISDNLLILDLDFKDGKKTKENIDLIFNELETKLPGIFNTIVISTPHGLHLYYYMKDFNETRHKNTNARYNDKNKFIGSLVTNFKHILKGFDILGEGGYALIPPSKVNDTNYEYIKKNEIKELSKTEFETIKTVMLLDQPIKIRSQFLDILNGKLEIKDQSSKTGQDEFLYWKALFRECYHNAGLEPFELFEGLKVNQPEFDQEKTIDQLKYHPYTDKPFTNEKLNEMFPQYDNKTVMKQLIAKKTDKSANNGNEVIEVVETEEFEEKKPKNIVLIEEKKEKFDEYEIVNIILESYPIKTIQESGEMRLYENGYYIKDQKRTVDKIISEVFKSNNLKYNISRKNTITQLIQDATLVSHETFDANPYILNLPNGLLNIKTKELKDHTPEYLSSIRKPVNYDPNAKCPVIDKFLNDVFDPEDIQFILEYSGLGLTPIMVYQMALILYGSGNNGKTTFLNLLNYLNGIINCAKVDPSQLDKGFISWTLENRSLNIVSDVETKKFCVRKFNQYIGMDLKILIDRKFKDPYQINPTAKMIFTCNETFPDVEPDTDKGFWRKWKIISCLNSFDGSKCDKNMLDKLTTPNELSGFLNICIDAFNTLETNKNFTNEDTWEDVRDFWLNKLNDVSQFITTNAIFEAKYSIDKDVVLNAINQHLKTIGKKQLSKSKITQFLHQQGYRDSRSENKYYGFKFKEGVKQIEKASFESEKNQQITEFVKKDYSNEEVLK